MEQTKAIKTRYLAAGFLIMLAMLPALTACNDDDGLEKDKTTGHTLTLTLKTDVEAIPETRALIREAAPGSEAAQAGFSYELVSSDADSVAVSSPMTKAPTTLKNVYALLFKSDGTFNGRANIGTMTANTNKIVTFTNVADPAATSCRLVIVANDNAATNNYASTGGTGSFANFTGNYANFQTLVMTNNIAADADVPYAGTATVNLFAGGVNATTSVQLYRTLAKVTVVNQTFSIPYTSQGGGTIPRTGIQLVNAGKKCFGTKNNYDGTGNNTNTAGVENSTSVNANTVTWYVGENVQSGYSATTATERNRLKAPDAARVTLTGSKTLATDDAYTCHFDVFMGKSGSVGDFSLRRHTNYTLTVNINNSLEFIRSYVTNSSGNLYYKNDDPRIWHSVASVWVPVNQALATTYKARLDAQEYTLTNYPPFNYDGGTVTGTLGSDYMGVSSTATVNMPYSFEVEKTERGSVISNYQAAIDYCKGLGTGWRVPTIIELKGMHENSSALQSAGCAAFINFWYWSSSVYNGDANIRCILDFSNGNFTGANLSDYGNYVRCVRDNLPPNKVTINQAVADAYKAEQSDLTNWPPFNYDYGTVTGTLGSDYKGKSSNATISTPYSIEVSKTQPAGTHIYNTAAAKNQCPSEWRLPTQIELFAIYQNKAKLEAISGFAAFISDNYWSSSVYNGSASGRCQLHLGNGSSTGTGTSNNNYVRCVRDI
ncbi:Lcl C-terminal domain-containing protein [Parabacteroides provencensis]|uniref:Lcl C-terminal domain-containing protein n=1 Tax=Parabacteroides provencensis TaxID=1944636 RepID=UPI000C14F02D|nr:DUF1566 domain-containing protein [Parabacteroides provencensis]